MPFNDLQKALENRAEDAFIEGGKQCKCSAIANQS